MKKMILLLAISVLSFGVLTACKAPEGTEQVLDPEVFSGATSGTDNFADLSMGLSEDGTWLAAINKDINEPDKVLEVNGAFENEKGEEARKLALYSQDSEHKVTERYILTIGVLTINSSNFYISNGTIKGNVEVNAEGFHGQTGEGIEGQATIDGNLIFKNQELLDAYNKLSNEDKVKVTGNIVVAS